jgi:hypothetical protein
MTHRPCHVCGAAAELPGRDGLCVICGDFVAQWQPLVVRERMRAAMLRGDHAEHRRCLKLLCFVLGEP